MRTGRGRVVWFAMGTLVLAVLAAPPAHADAFCEGPLYFAQATSLTTAWNPTFIATGDFNGDGITDLAVANSFREVSRGVGSSVSILLGHGDGTFAPPVNYGAGSEPRSIAAGDFNHDGITDLAVADQGSNTVSILIGHGSGGVGDGTFAPPVSYLAGAGAFHVRAADFNEDGITDLVVSNNSVASISVLLGQGSAGVGDGTFAAPTSYPLNQLSTGLAVGDFNSDGILDVVATENYLGTIAVFLGNGSGGVGNGSFASAVHYAAGPEPFDITVHDFDGDGISDLAVANTSNGGVALMRGNGSGGLGNGTFASPSFVPSGNSAQATPIDANHDGITDLLVSVAGPTPSRITLYLGQGTGVFGSAEFGNPSDYEVGGDPIQTALVDFDGDHVLDVAVPNYFNDYISILMGNCTRDPRRPVLTSVRDVPNDEGGKVFVTWTRSSLDVTGGAVTNYRVWRRIPPAMLQTLMARRAGSEPEPLIVARAARPAAKSSIVYWEALATLPAQRMAGYGYTAATTQDSMRHSNPYTAFFITALTNDIDVFYDSEVDSGYSVDNLPPHKPGHFVAQPLTEPAIALHWDASPEPDVVGYRLYRGNAPDFVPDAGSLLATPPDTGYVDPNGAGFSYKLSAVDAHGNEGPPVAVTTQSTTTVESMPLVFALKRTVANPSLGGRLTVSVTLPDALPARLMVMDVTGRQVSSQWVSGAGERSIVLAPPGQLATGVYLISLVRGQEKLRIRAVVIR